MLCLCLHEFHGTNQHHTLDQREAILLLADHSFRPPLRCQDISQQASASTKRILSRQSAKTF